MPWELYLVFGVAGAVLIGAAAVAGSSAQFWYGMGKLLLADLWPALQAAIAARKTPEEEAIDRDFIRRGQVRPTRQRPHPGER